MATKKKFRIEIDLGAPEVTSPSDLAEVLRSTAARLDAARCAPVHLPGFVIRAPNGASIGKGEVV